MVALRILRQLVVPAVVLLLAGCGDETSDAPVGRAGSTSSESSPSSKPEAAGAVIRGASEQSARTTDVHGEGAASLVFVDVTEDVGLDFIYESNPPESYYLPGIMGGGAAVFDANNDGRLDLYLLNGRDDTATNGLRNRLLLMGTDGRFMDDTNDSGLGDRGFAMGAALGDVDNDGDLDVYVSNDGPDRLFRNEGDGTFTDVSTRAGITNDVFSGSVAFLDLDRDGWLDVYVANYVGLDASKECEDQAGRKDFCGPESYPARADVLYRNLGDGTFEDVTVQAGIDVLAYAGLGVVCADLDSDGWVDVFVANDGDPNLLWVNQRDGTFSEDGTIAGAAYSATGQAEAGMGVTVGDADGDGDLDLYLTHFAAETNTFYRNEGGMVFDDATARARLGETSTPYTGWGTVFFDADLDGDLDIAVVNGAVLRRTPPLTTQRGFWSDYAEPNHIYRNEGGGRYVDVTADAGAFGEDISVTRGVVPFDYDGDGDLDLLVMNVGSAARLYRNDTASSGSLLLSVLDRTGRAALGATVRIQSDAGGVTRHIGPPGGYLTSAPSDIHLGLSPGSKVHSVDVRWPDGHDEQFDVTTHGASLTIRQGEGSTRP